MGISNLAQDYGVVVLHATRFKAKILREEGVFDYVFLLNCAFDF